MEQIAGQNKRIKLIVAYDGTDYCGWQIQPSGITIEEVLNRELSTLLGEEIRVTGASRTDSGVHSLGNVAVFDTKTRIPADKLCYALNQRLPEDIVVQSSCEVARDFHPRRCYSEKTYEYRILNRKIPLPTLRRYTYFYYWWGNMISKVSVRRRRLWRTRCAQFFPVRWNGRRRM